MINRLTETKEDNDLSYNTSCHGRFLFMLQWVRGSWGWMISPCSWTPFIEIVGMNRYKFPDWYGDQYGWWVMPWVVLFMNPLMVIIERYRKAVIHHRTNLPFCFHSNTIGFAFRTSIQTIGTIICCCYIGKGDIWGLASVSIEAILMRNDTTEASPMGKSAIINESGESSNDEPNASHCGVWGAVSVGGGSDFSSAGTLAYWTFFGIDDFALLLFPARFAE